MAILTRWPAIRPVTRRTLRSQYAMVPLALLAKAECAGYLTWYKSTPEYKAHQREAVAGMLKFPDWWHGKDHYRDALMIDAYASTVDGIAVVEALMGMFRTYGFDAEPRKIVKCLNAVSGIPKRAVIKAAHALHKGGPGDVPPSERSLRRMAIHLARENSKEDASAAFERTRAMRLIMRADDPVAAIDEASAEYGDIAAYMAVFDAYSMLEAEYGFNVDGFLAARGVTDGSRPPEHLRAAIDAIALEKGMPREEVIARALGGTDEA